ncbi:capsular biosynthesis protein [Polynucleobacter sp. UK-Kesae-W10]|uniref:capsular polysaccharide export protein, LipB/KpsS family n=1 Tax=Polynucleobacter sp. UK-Kesae-W10 TaxID=1819738 RepID=UPI001C0CD178|nr:capsular biosynthesis protein [Polynucleobacter sp. UK-Kesae-W10]MBU3576938.1 hypothetical protein [Polynucleobacter sp. UK-Kesae-W10]
MENNQDTLPSVLTVGFDNEVLLALKTKFNVAFSIADSVNADLNWHEFHELDIDYAKPFIDSKMQACLQNIRQHYLQFVDINSRRHYYIPGRESETYNGFLITFYKAYQLLTEKKIELILHANIPHEGFDFIIHKIACHLGIPSVLCYQSLIPNRFWLTSTVSEFGCHSTAPDLFEFEPSGYKLPDTWFYMRGSERDSSYGIGDLFFEVLRRPYRLPPALVRFAYAYQFRRNVQRLTTNFIKGNPFIYFPLHLQPELTTAAIGGIYADQILALETLSSLLPSNYLIYVKENPKQTEKQRGPFFYKRLATLKNVRLLSKHENSINLIRSSAGIATITGTAGWEALFYGKPVLVFGAAWYREFTGVTMFGDGFNIQHFLNSAPSEPTELVAELDRALKKSGKGVVDPAYQELIPGFDKLENAQLVAQSIFKFIQARTKTLYK